MHSGHLDTKVMKNDCILGSYCMIKTVPEKSKVTLLTNCDKFTTENRFNHGYFMK
jgi:hypothetical protein